VGWPNLRILAGLWGDLDTAHVMERNHIDHVTGSSARNQLYYDFMTQQGVKNPKTSYTRAPDYIRAGAAAAFTYGAPNTPDDIIPDEFIQAYNSGKGKYNDADLQAIMDLIIANSQPAEKEKV